MAKPFYPFISTDVINALTTLSEQIIAYEDFLDRPECPYDPITKEMLRRMIRVKAEVPVAPDQSKITTRRIETAEMAVSEGSKRGRKLKDGGVIIDDVAKEIEAIRAELQQLKLDSTKLPTNEKIQIIKTRAALVEKLIAMSERCINIKTQSRFMTTVMGLLDDLVPNDERLEFIRRLEPFAD